MTVASGKNIIAALVLKSPSEIPLSELVDRLEFLEIDPERQHIEPFCVLVHGITEYGKYRIFDAETLEELDFVEPFGLPPQPISWGLRRAVVLTSLSSTRASSPMTVRPS
ncbi:MAG: hypothetical protein ACOX4B_01705 [Bacillota bacterium]